MKNLYIDFDGVILDTIKVTYDMVDRLEINREDFEKMSEFYENLNWKKVLSLTPIINDAFNDIKKLYNAFAFSPSHLTPNMLENSSLTTCLTLLFFIYSKIDNSG